MPKLKNRYPKKCRDRNQCFSCYNGRRYYHGVWGSPEADKSYKRFIAALLESPFLPLQDNKTGDVLVSELVAGFLNHLEALKTDKTDLLHFKRAIGFLIEVYGELSVNEFSPKKLRVCRSQMVKAGTLCRSSINKYVGRIRRIFEWGVGEEVVQSNVSDALKAVKDLRKGEEGTYDNPPRKEVSDDVVAATLPFMSPTVAAMVQIQRLTGMGLSEVYRMTVGDIDKARKPGLWHYVPRKHKTEEHIGQKPIPLSKHEQALIAPYLIGKNPTEAVFSPRTAMQEWKAERRANRKTKVSPSQQERNRRRAKNPADNVGDFYDKHSYRQAIDNAIKKGNRHGQTIPHWTPYRLRHSAGTEAEKTGGLDKAQALLGHKTANVTKRYAHAQLAIAEEMARKRENPFAEKADFTQ